MEALNESLLESSTQIIYSVDGISAGLKIYWSRLLQFFFAGSLNATQIQQREITAAAQRKHHPNEAARIFQTLSPQEQVWMLATLQILALRAQQVKDWQGHRQLSALIDVQLTPLTTQENQRKAAEKFLSISKEVYAFENRKVFVVPGSIKLLVLDFVIRWIMLIAGNMNSIDPGILFGFNFFPPFLILGLAYVVNKKDKQFNTSLINSHYPDQQYQFRFSLSKWQYSVMALFLVSGAIVSTFLMIDIKWFFGLAMSLLLIVYYTFVLRAFPLGRLSTEDFFRQTHQDDDSIIMDADKNDEAIVSLETKVNSSTARLEAYVLESALFGALSFSGFLQIIATNLISFTDLENFAQASFHVVNGLIKANWEEVQKYGVALASKESLFCLVSIESLVCSGLFLAVIASRLRFSDVADNIRSSLNLAKAYNEKEEKLMEGSVEKNPSARMVILNQRVNDHVNEARLAMKRIWPIVDYMVFFRNAGTLVFMIVLVSSCLFISSVLSWSFIAVGLVTWAYFNRTQLEAWVRGYTLNFKVFFARYSGRVLIASGLPVLVAFFLSVILKVENSDWLLAIGAIAMGLYLFIWLALMPHYDHRFGDIENLENEAWRSSRWKMIKNLYGAFAVVVLIGICMKMFRMTGANEMLMVSLTGIVLLNYFMAYYLSRPRWLGVTAGFFLGSCSVGILFRVLSLAGGSEMLAVAVIYLGIFFVIYFFRKKSFHYVLIRMSLVFFILSFLMSVLVVSPSPMTRLQLMYEHHTTDAAAIVNIHNVFYMPDPPGTEQDLNNSILVCDEYIKTYGDRVGRTPIHKAAFNFYEEIGNSILNNEKYAKDTTYLKIASRAGHQINKISALFNYDYGDVLLEADALLALGEKERALTYLNQILAVTDGERTKEEVQSKIKAISGN